MSSFLGPIAIVVGANDVVNPAAMAQPGTPIYGMPIIRADLAKHVMVLNYDTQPGYAGVPNSLYEEPHVSLLLGDAKETLEKVLGFLRQPQKEVAGGRPSEAGSSFPSRASDNRPWLRHGPRCSSAPSEGSWWMSCKAAASRLKSGSTLWQGECSGHMNVLLAEVDTLRHALHTG